MFILVHLYDQVNVPLKDKYWLFVENDYNAYQSKMVKKKLPPYQQYYGKACYGNIIRKIEY